MISFENNLEGIQLYKKIFLWFIITNLIEGTTDFGIQGDN